MKMSGGGFGSAVDLTAGADMVDARRRHDALKWSGQAEARGPIAAVGGRVLDAQAKKLIEQAFANSPPAVDDDGLAEVRTLKPGRLRTMRHVMTDSSSGSRALAAGRPVVRRRDGRRPARAGVGAPGRPRDHLRRRPHGRLRRRRVLARDRQAAGARVMRRGSGRLVSIRPDASEPSASTAEHVVVPMTCVSEGAVDVYVEPFVRRASARRGRRDAGCRRAGAAGAQHGLRVVRVVDARERRDIEPEAAALGFTVVTLDALASDRRRRHRRTRRPSSRRRGTTTRRRSRSLSKPACRTSAWSRRASGARPCERCSRSSGVPGVATMRNPAGLDLGARTAPEVALSILAEIVQVAAEPAARGAGSAGAGAGRRAPAIAVDPVCGMEVDDRHGAPHGGGRRRHLLLLLRELPGAIPQASLRRLSAPTS